MREDHEDLKDKSERKMLDLTNPVQTRDGRKVEIISMNGRGNHSVLGYIDDNELVAYWTKEGKVGLSCNSPGDLINIPNKKSGWINIYRQNGCISQVYENKESAILNCNKEYRLTTIFIEWEE